MGKSMIEGSGRLGSVLVPHPPVSPVPATDTETAEENTVSVNVTSDRGDSTLSVREISNGYIVQEEHYDPSGDMGGRFVKVETFTPNKPDIEIK